MSEAEVSPITGTPVVTADDYTKGNEVRRGYIAAVLAAQGASVHSEWMPRIENHSESVLVQQFFRSFEGELSYGPQSKLGQLVQMLACEVSTQARMVDIFSRGSDRVNNEYIPTAVETLAEIRKTKKALAQEIFGDQKDQYLPQFQSTFFMHRNKEAGKSPKNLKAERDQQLRVVVQQIAQTFPITSK